MSASILLERLIEALRCLPGIGPKSARRLAYHLLQRDRDGGRTLAKAIGESMDGVGNCRRCRTLTESEICGICSGEKRDSSLLCVVESPADVAAIEQTANYRGLYFVLMGHLSPLDGIGPSDIGLDLLAERLNEGGISELVLATNPTVEGSATAHYIGEMARAKGICVTRIAHGVPLGGELEYIDSGTLSHAFAGRRAFD